MRVITASPDPVQKYRDRIQYLIEMSGVAVVITMDHSQLTVIVHFLQFFRITDRNGFIFISMDDQDLAMVFSDRIFRMYQLCKAQIVAIKIEQGDADPVRDIVGRSCEIVRGYGGTRRNRCRNVS